MCLSLALPYTGFPSGNVFNTFKVAVFAYVALQAHQPPYTAYSL
jgi:hypothetical protein